MPRSCAFVNEVRLPTPLWGELALNLFKELVPFVRAEFIHDLTKPALFDDEVTVGSRVKSDEHVLLTLQSNVTEEQFLLNPVTMIYEALHSCAERDWWYANEKKWDDKDLGSEQ